MTDIHDAETQASCPIVITHRVSVQARWTERDMLGFRCARCGEFSVDSMGQLQLDQYAAWKREQISQVLAAVWNNGKGAAARLNPDGVSRVAAVPFASTKEEPFGKPLEAGVAALTKLFLAQRQARS